MAASATAESVQAVLDRVAAVVDESGRKIVENRDVTSAIQDLNSCKVNLQRISNRISEITLQTVVASVDALLEIARQAVHDHSDSHVEPMHTFVDTSPDVPAGRGRPSLQISDDQIRSLFSNNFTAKAIADALGCSASYVYKRLHHMGLAMRSRYATVSDTELADHVSELQTEFPNCGAEMLSGYLRLSGMHVQRARVRAALTAVNPVAAASRWSRTTARRSYRVASPNSLWHIDSHLKLVRWGFYTQAGIDGYSRVIVYIRCSTTNRAEDVLDGFCTACNKYGVPSRVRSDHGNENMLVGVLMNVLKGTNRGSFITGRSVHNQRVERLWRDVHKEVTQSLYVKFYDMEDAGKLQADNDVHRLALHTVFLPILNDRLSQFATAWNTHRIRTAHNNTPNQLWVAGMIHAVESGSQTVANEFLEGRNSTLHERVMQKLAELGADTTDAADVPMPRNSQEAISLTTEQQDELQATIGSISDVDVKFEACVTKLNEILQRNVHDQLTAE